MHTFCTHTCKTLCGLWFPFYFSFLYFICLLFLDFGVRLATAGHLLPHILCLGFVVPTHRQTSLSHSLSHTPLLPPCALLHIVPTSMHSMHAFLALHAMHGMPCMGLICSLCCLFALLLFLLPHPPTPILSLIQSLFPCPTTIRGEVLWFGTGRDRMLLFVGLQTHTFFSKNLGMTFLLTLSFTCSFLRCQ